MKLKSRLVALCLIFVFSTAAAQDILGSLNQTARMHNESRGLEEDNNDSSASNEDRQSWEEMMATAAEEYKASLNGLGAYEKCYAMMILYLEKYYKLEDAIQEETDCKMKYDGYGLQLLAIAGSQTIMYCPEKISNLSDATQEEALKGFVSKMNSGGYGDLKGAVYYLIMYKFQHSIEDGTIPDSVPDEFTEWLWQHFHPAFTISKTLEISQKMEALGCG